jgi:hypothetical protein
VLWVGDPEALPLGGWELTDGVAYAVSEAGVPDVRNLWPGSARAATPRLADAITEAAMGGTSRLGRELAPFGVRYVIVPDRAAPALTDVPRHPAPAPVLDALAGQLDLSRVDVDEALVVYENTAWAPLRARLPADSGDLAAAEAVLPEERSYVRFEGDVAPGSDVHLSASSSTRWELEVGGDEVPRTDIVEWANAWRVDGGGDATLRYRTSPLRFAAIGGQAALWVGAVALLVARRRSAAAGARSSRSRSHSPGRPVATSRWRRR